MEVDEILSKTKQISTDETEFQNQLEGRTVSEVKLTEDGQLHLYMENGDHVEIGGRNAPPQFSPNIVTEQSVTA